MTEVLTISKVPTVFETFMADCTVDGKAVELALWDTAGQEGYARLRPLAYSNAQVILIGFSIDTPDSLDNAKRKWIEEATRLCSGVPIILVGLKKDLRKDPITIEEMSLKSLRFVAEREGEIAAQEIGAKRYLECSSLSGEGVEEVFESAIRAALLTVQKVKGEVCCAVL
ncbi:Rho GTPase [Fusarium falciforme]